MQNDPKAWVRQWIAIMMSIYVITLGILAFCLPDISVTRYFEFTGVAYGYIGWFFRARDIEKKQASLKK